MTIPVIAVVIAGASVALTMVGLLITVIVLLVRGGFLMGQLVRQVKDLEDKVEGHDAKFDALETKMDAKFDAMDAKFDAKIDDLETKMNAKFDAMDAKMDARFDALNARMDALTAAVQQNYAILMAMANHTHDSDGRVVFTVIPGDR